MKSYVITIMDEPKSVESAERCIASCPGTRMFPAITPKDNPDKIFEQEKLITRYFVDQWSFRENCMSAFLSHYFLWKKCFEENEEYQIFEHDAVVVNNLPDVIRYDKCINLGKPSYGQWHYPASLGVNPLTSKEYFPGAHAYRIKPSAAAAFIKKAKFLAGPTDVFLRTYYFPWLQEFYPWPAEARDSFSTIQREKGCELKHSVLKKQPFEVLRVR